MKKLLAVYLILFISSCCTRKQEKNVATSDEHWKELKYAEGEIMLPEGMAGCSYLIKLKDESMLQPLNLADSLKHEKLKLWVRYHTDKAKMSVCMMGTIVIIDDIQYRK